MSLTPVKPKSRIDLLDVYRGFAVFGIFVVNSVIMHSTFVNQDAYLAQFTSWYDRGTQQVLQLFFYTKFFPIFSLLFGLGIAMQILKRRQEHQPVAGFLGRRMGFLFLFGAAHIIFLWSGDVIHLYALLGMSAVVCIKASNKVLLWSSLLLLCFPFYDLLLEWLFNSIHFDPFVYLEGFDGERINQIITEGAYTQGLVLRLREYLVNLPMLFGFLAPIALAMFLLGVYLGKNKLVYDLKSFILKLKKPALLIAVITNVYRILFLRLFTSLDLYKTEGFRSAFIKMMVICDVAMGLFYLWVLGWLWYMTPFQKLLHPLKYVGQMALTNYIVQSAIGLFLFSSVGLGWYEQLSPTQVLLLAVSVFIVQVFFSKLWLSYFKYGPLEWLWRCLSYKTLLKIRR